MPPCTVVVLAKVWTDHIVTPNPHVHSELSPVLDFVPELLLAPGTLYKDCPQLLKLQWIKAIYYCHLYTSDSQGVGIVGVCTFNTTPAGFGIFTASGVCPQVKGITKC